MGAARWLRHHHLELEGDDCVGWWLLLFLGERLSFDVEQRFREQQHRLLSTGVGSLYTLTAISRTLERATAQENTSAIVTKLMRWVDDSAKNKTLTLSRNESRNIVWAMQTLFELGALDNKKTRQWADGVLRRCIISDVVTYAMLEPVIKLCLRAKEAELLSKRWRRALKVGANPSLLNGLLDWEVSYLLLLALSAGLMETAEALTEYLVARQTESQWDESSDENIESTSLVGLALAAYRCRTVRSAPSLGSAEHNHFVLLAIGDGLRRTDEVAELWEELNRVRDRNTKGRALEQFVRVYCEGDRNTRVHDMNLRTRTEEIDLVLENREGSQCLRELNSRFILIECKYTNEKVSAKVVRDFCAKVRNRKPGLCRVGVIISVAGFTEDADQELFRANSQEKDLYFAGVDAKAIGLALRQGRSLSSLIEDAVVALAKR